MELVLCWTLECRRVGARLHQALSPLYPVDVVEPAHIDRGVVTVPAEVGILSIGGAPRSDGARGARLAHEALGVGWWTARNLAVVEAVPGRATHVDLDVALDGIESDAQRRVGAGGDPSRQRTGAALALAFLDPSLGITSDSADPRSVVARDRAYELVLSHFLLHGFDAFWAGLARTATPPPRRR